MSDAAEERVAAAHSLDSRVIADQVQTLVYGTTSRNPRYVAGAWLNVAAEHARTTGIAVTLG
jgi:hypothetical protein